MIRGLMGKVRQDVAPQSLSPCLLPALHKRVENAFQLTTMNLMTTAATAASGLPGVRVLHWQSQSHTLVPLPVCAVAGVFQWVFARLKPSP